MLEAAKCSKLGSSQTAAARCGIHAHLLAVVQALQVVVPEILQPGRRAVGSCCWTCTLAAGWHRRAACCRKPRQGRGTLGSRHSSTSPPLSTHPAGLGVLRLGHALREVHPNGVAPASGGAAAWMGTGVQRERSPNQRRPLPPPVLVRGLAGPPDRCTALCKLHSLQSELKSSAEGSRRRQAGSHRPCPP